MMKNSKLDGIYDKKSESQSQAQKQNVQGDGETNEINDDSDFQNDIEEMDLIEKVDEGEDEKRGCS